ncbi:hypothetical protein HZH66_004483 [Vespula vulgaris]|uniref:Uncharacterized protein n=1 Tax=Vespula vulgaris TaxID=7454 RepID=A0A834KFE0_VESVU|nr:uncharacterized protein LOC127062802 [Vespula vulgaris]KAF7405577.1 hypothetical protein HZH66_004483 [Vespula vulgaris]
MGDRKSREKIDCPRSNKENFEEDRVLSPIEEESESSTEQLADYTTNDPEDDSFYQTTHFRYKDCRSGFPKNYDRKRQDDLSFRSNVPNNVKNSSSGESTSGDERNTASGNCCFQMCDRSKLETEASGDNDEGVHSSPRVDNVPKTLKWFENRLSQCETEIVGLRKQFGLEKFQNRRYALQCYEKHAQTQNILKNDLQAWKNNLDARIKAQIVRWQLDERKRISEEIAKVTGMCSQEITKTLQKSMNEWQEKDSQKITELIRNERLRQDVEMQNTRKVYEKIQKHLQNLDKRNRNSYVNFRKQMSVWEERLKDEVIRLHENSLKEFRQQPKFWHSDQDGIKNNSLKSPVRMELPMDLQRRSQDQEYNFIPENALVKYREINAKDIRRLEQNFKSKLQNQRDEFTKLLTTKFVKLWEAFEQFKHNFQFDRRYRDYDYARIHDDEPEIFTSSVMTDQAEEEAADIANNNNQEDCRKTKISGKR